MNARERLRRIELQSYGLGMQELLTAQAVMTYLSSQTEEEAQRLIREVMRREDYHPVCREKPIMYQIEVQGNQLALLIDAATEYIRVQLKNQMAVAKSDEELSLRAVSFKAVAEIDGRRTVENVTIRFLSFLEDCFRELE